jgi:CDP-2,3-bis-(O-geranylgeranyl)-sn-glycerol synthase
MDTSALHLLVFIIVANASPIMLSRLLGKRLNYPMDFNFILADGFPLLGATKTWRGILAALIITPMFSWIYSYPIMVGIKIALASMLGDMLSSFVKRRLKKPSSTRVLFLDQLPECLLPLLLMQKEFHLSWQMVIIISALFLMIEILLSKVIHKLNIKR